MQKYVPNKKNKVNKPLLLLMNKSSRSEVKVQEKLEVVIEHIGEDVIQHDPNHYCICR
jgi:ribonucleotide monophosphatase NagD (HAD superfamily)